MIIVSPLLIFTRSYNSPKQIIDKLEKKNIAKRINNKNDRRSKSICLTPDGVTLAQKLINTQNVMLKKIWSGLSDDEMKTFELANKKLLSNLNVN